MDPTQAVKLSMAVLAAYETLRPFLGATQTLAAELEAGGHPELAAELLRDGQAIGRSLEAASELIPGVKEATAAAIGGLESIGHQHAGG